MNDIPMGDLFEKLAPNAALLMMLLFFGYKVIKDNQKERKVEAEKEALRRKVENDRLIDAHTNNYEKIQVTLNDYLGDFASMNEKLRFVEKEQLKAGTERTEMLRVLQTHYGLIQKNGAEIKIIELKREIKEQG
jgi:flagellar motility protein MotE (MotC chaperone)